MVLQEEGGWEMVALGVDGAQGAGGVLHDFEACGPGLVSLQGAVQGWYAAHSSNAHLFTAFTPVAKS